MSQDNSRDFTCPQCESRYRLVRAKAGPGTSDQPVHCVICGHALASRDGKYVLKYADEKAAIEAAAREFKIADALRDRIVARRDE